MRDNLVALLRRPYGNLTFAEKQEVADLIEELEAKLTQQDDLVQAAVAAALREAAGVCVKDWLATAGECQEAVLALITEDAQAALDRVMAARFGTVRSEVVRLSAEGKMDNETTERLLAAIRKGED